jgi:tetratricopeptide (TPR) repeat protein
MKTIKSFFKNNSLSSFVTIFIIAVSFVLLDCSSKESTKIPITTTSEKAIEYYSEGMILQENFRGHEAVYFYLKALSEDPDFAMAYLKMAQVQTTPKQFLKYLTKAQSKISNISKGEKLLILIAEAGASGNQEEQNDYYVELIELYPNDEGAHLTYGHFLFGLQKYKKAIDQYKITIDINPDFSQTYNMLGYSYRRLDDFEQAEKYFIKYIDLLKDNPNPYDSYAELLMKMGKFESSIDYYRKALEISSDYIPSIIGIATNLNLLDQHKASIKELERIKTITSDPGYLRMMHFAKAVSRVDIGDFDGAIKEIKENISLSKSIEDNIALAEDISLLGSLHLMDDKFDDALKYYEKSIEFFEKSNLSQDQKYNMRQQLFVNAGRVAFYTNDINTLKKYTEKYKSSAQQAMNPYKIRYVHELTGYIYLFEENLPKAIFEFKQANQENPIILYLIGTAYEELGDRDKARKIYESVANFNSLNDINFAFIRKRALAKLSN